MSDKESRLLNLLFLFADGNPEQEAELKSSLKGFTAHEISALISGSDEMQTFERSKIVIAAAKLVVIEKLSLADGINILIKFSKDKSPDVTESFLKAVQYLYDNSPDAIKRTLEKNKDLSRFLNPEEYQKLISELAAEKSGAVAASLIKKAGEYNRPDSIETIKQFLKHSDSRARLAACEVIAKFRESDIAPLLIPLLTDNTERVKTAALAALKKLPSRTVNDAAQTLITRKTAIESALVWFSMNYILNKSTLNAYMQSSDPVVKNTARKIVSEHLRKTSIQDYISHLFTQNKEIRTYSGIAAGVIFLIAAAFYFFSGDSGSTPGVNYFSQNKIQSSSKIDINKVAKTEKDRKVLEFLEKTTFKEPATPAFPSNTPRELRQILEAETHPDLEKAALAIFNKDFASAKSILENLLRTSGENTYMEMQALSSLIFIAELEKDQEALAKLRKRFFEVSNRSKLLTITEGQNMSDEEFEAALKKMNDITMQQFAPLFKTN